MVSWFRRHLRGFWWRAPAVRAPRDPRNPYQAKD